MTRNQIERFTGRITAWIDKFARAKAADGALCSLLVFT